MSLNSRIKPNQIQSGTLGITGAAPLTVADTASHHFIKMVNVDLGSLSANLAVTATTSSLALTAVWQASDDASTWVDCAAASNCPAPVTIVTGTGSAVSKTQIVPAPPGVYGKRYARITVRTSGATGGGSGGGDTCSISYNFRLPNAFNG
jgi:hypothetical protein